MHTTLLVIRVTPKSTISMYTRRLCGHMGYTRIPHIYASLVLYTGTHTTVDGDPVKQGLAVVAGPLFITNTNNPSCNQTDPRSRLLDILLEAIPAGMAIWPICQKHPIWVFCGSDIGGRIEAIYSNMANIAINPQNGQNGLNRPYLGAFYRIDKSLIPIGIRLLWP